MSQHYDVIVVGGGMVGATLTVALSQDSTLKIALIEAQQVVAIKETDKPDLRVSALTQASETLFKNLKIWPLLIKRRISTFTDMHVWETPESHLHFDSAEIGQPCLGHIIENRHIQQACLSAAGQQQQNIDLLCPAKPIALEGNLLSLDSGQQLTADLIVGADGAGSRLREWKNIQTHGWDYQQSAVVCTVITEKDHQHTAWQRFLSQGPLAFLPLADEDQCSVVWSNSTNEAKLISQLDDETFKTVLANNFEHALGNIVDVSPRAQFPLKLRHADHYIESGFALVGDAAHTIHPIAGQGVNIGLLDAATLAEVIIDAHQKRRDIGSLHTLNKYQRRRKSDNMAMQLTMDAFKRLFSSEFGPIKWARRFGLKTVNQSNLLKSLFMQQASGHRFANPKISKPKL